jgi:hypothetical protein
MNSFFIRLVVVIIFCTTTYASCNKNCVESKYSFEIGMKIYPNIETININDTLWLEVNSNTVLKDNISGEMIDYSFAGNLGTALSFLEFTGGSISNPGAVYAVSAFRYILMSGEEVIPHFLPEKVKEYKFDEKQGSFKFRLGVIASKKGVFAIGISNASNVFKENDKCTKAAFSIPLKETNNHIHLLEQNRPGYIPSGLEITNLYCFRVN